MVGLGRPWNESTRCTSRWAPYAVKMALAKMEAPPRHTPHSAAGWRVSMLGGASEGRECCQVGCPPLCCSVSCCPELLKRGAHLPAWQVRTHKGAGHTTSQHILKQSPQVVHAQLSNHAEPITVQGVGDVQITCGERRGKQVPCWEKSMRQGQQCTGEPPGGCTNRTASSTCQSGNSRRRVIAAGALGRVEGQLRHLVDCVHTCSLDCSGERHETRWGLNHLGRTGAGGAARAACQQH